MKKFYYIAILFIGFLSFGQKTFEIYNFSSYPIDIAEIMTKPNSSATYPTFSSKSYGMIPLLNPGDYYVLENTSNTFRFPFESPSSTPYITTWDRANSSNSVTAFPSNQAWIQGNNQVFYSLGLYDAAGYYSGTVPVGTVTYIPSWITHPDWVADYECSNPATNVWIYTIIIY